MIQGLIKAGYVNSNVASITLDQGFQLFPQKKAAMSFTTDGNVLVLGKDDRRFQYRRYQATNLGNRQPREHLRYDAILG